MNLKKALLFALITCFIFTMVVGCTGKTTQGQTTSEKSTAASTSTEPTPKPIKTFKLYNGDSNAKPEQMWDTPVGKKIEELTRVKIEMDFCVGSDEKTKAAVMIASEDYPDFIIAHNVEQEFINAGAFIPIEDYIEKYGTNIKKIYATALKKYINPTDKHIYGLNSNRPGGSGSRGDTGYWLPVDALKANNWPTKLTFDQYLDIIRAYVKNNPTYNGKPTIGFTSETDGWRMSFLVNQPSYVNGYPNDGGVYIDQKTYDAKMIAGSEISKKYFQKLNMLWNEGLFDKEAFTQNYDQLMSKISSGRVIGFYDHKWQISDARKALEKQNMLDRVPFCINVLEEGVTDDTYLFPQVESTRVGIAISKKCAEPEEAFKFLERVCEEDIQKLMYWGIEGEDYTVGSDGKYVLSADQLKHLDDPDYVSKQGYRNLYLLPRMAGTEKYADGNFADPTETDEYYQSLYVDYEKEILKNMKITKFSDIFTPAKLIPYGIGYEVGPESGSNEELDSKKMEPIVNKYVPKLIMAKPGQYEAVWKEYTEKLGALNLPAIEKVISDKIKARVASWN